jgi:hypothetical protein
MRKEILRVLAVAYSCAILALLPRLAYQPVSSSRRVRPLSKVRSANRTSVALQQAAVQHERSASVLQDAEAHAEELARKMTREDAPRLARERALQAEREAAKARRLAERLANQTRIHEKREARRIEQMRKNGLRLGRSGGNEDEHRSTGSTHGPGVVTISAGSKHTGAWDSTAHSKVGAYADLAGSAAGGLTGGGWQASLIPTGAQCLDGEHTRAPGCICLVFNLD